VVSAWAGFQHPLTGIDHALAMIAVGLWAVQLGRRAIWVLPTTFPLAMIVGALLAQAGIALPAMETMIAASVALMGLAVASGMRIPVIASSIVVGTFAVFHGYAHAIDASDGGLSWQYVLGFAAATVMLHGAGLVGGMLMTQRSKERSIVRFSGALIALTGAALLVV
jgi:urease accessory protein